MFPLFNWDIGYKHTYICCLHMYGWMHKKYRNNLRVCFTSQFVSQLFKHLAYMCEFASVSKWLCVCVCVELLIIVCWGERETMLVVVVLPPNNSTVTLTEAVCPNQQIGYICLPHIVLMLICLLPIIFVVWLQLFFAVIVAQRSTERERAPTVMSLFRFPFVSLALSTYTHTHT